MSATTDFAHFGTIRAGASPRRMRSARSFSLRRRLALLAVAACAPMLLLFAGEGLADYRAERERTGQRQLDIARSMVGAVERELAGALASLQVLALSPGLQQGDLAGFLTLARRYTATQPDGTALVLLDLAGRPLVNTSASPGATLVPRSPALNELLTRRVFETGQPVISNLYPAERNGALVVTADVPVLRSFHVAYDLSVVLPAARFSAILASQNLAQGTVISAFDRNAVHVARVPASPGPQGRPASSLLLPALLARGEGVIDTVGPDGARYLTAFSHSAPSGWAVAISVPEAALRAPLQQRLWLLLAAGLTGLATSLGMAYALAQRVLVPMRDLARFAADPARPLTAHSSSLREVHEVTLALRHSLAERQSAMDALQQLNGELEGRVRQEIARSEQAQTRLAQAQRMEALGQLAGGIAHDFNNVLQAVTGGLSLIHRRAADGDEVRRLAAMASGAASRGASITGRLLTFARRGELHSVAIAPASLLESLQEILTHTLGGTIVVKVEADAALPRLRADRAQLETVLVNLAVNARDAMPSGGTLSLSAVADADASRLWPPEMRNGRYVRLTLADTGTGMDAATLSRASEPFFTTKGPGKGTGLGLAMARGFAVQSGGGFLLQSAPGRGTTVTLWFPEAEAEALAAPPDCAAEPDPALPPMRLMLVDDESMVREVMAYEMEDRGFEVTTACNAAAALALLDAGQAIDLLITDYAMPGLHGMALIEEARRRRPGLPAILLTGYAEGDTELTVPEHRLTVRLAKPISGEALAARAAKLRRRPNAAGFRERAPVEFRRAAGF